MTRPYVTWLRVEDFRCIRSVDVRLTRLHALVGPNDSGKTTLLRAIQGHPKTHFWVSGTRGGLARDRGIFVGSHPHAQPTNVDQSTHDTIYGAVQQIALLRLDPDELRVPSKLIPRGSRLWFQGERGRGLSALYDALLSRDRGAFQAIDDRFRELFPTTQALSLDNPDNQTKALGLQLKNGSVVDAGSMSEGMLYWLAFAIIEHLAPHAILLIEEPENGLHPARIGEVMKVLRAMSERTQIVLATHSPLVINELQSEEVTVVTRTPERGTICTPMTDTKNFGQRSKIYALGELWLSYADGELEKGLVGDEPDAKGAAAG